jgi:16S rRNA (guanine1516-N2)-methyltransferase
MQTQQDSSEHPESLLSVPLLYAPCADADTAPAMLVAIQELIAHHHLPLSLTPSASTHKLTQKYRQQLSSDYSTPLFIIDDKGELSLLIDGISVAPNWAKLQRRIVSAGRKSELLLQAAKLTADMQALDATAGFGHDSLILASTGAQVTMLEQQPLLALLLLVEQQKMASERNWQKLMARLTIINNTAEAYLASPAANTVKYDTVYLDPMFPDDSYDNSKTGKGAKVGKNMQALHGLVAPPTSEAEIKLFELAQAAITHSTKQESVETGIDNSSRRLIVKRPISAPHLAGYSPDESWQNDVVRFDGYFG